MAERIICPKCRKVAYTASPQVKSKCPYCEWEYSQTTPLAFPPSRALKSGLIHAISLDIKADLKR